MKPAAKKNYTDVTPLISILIPVYNIEKYLESCINSILTQNFENFEIICVNDGSTDNSLNLLYTLKETDARIRIITTVQNKGSGVARNTALRYAKGKYILFVDGDDKLEQCALSKIYRYAEKNDTDILVFGAFSYYTDKNKPTKRAGSYDYKKIPSKFFARVFSAKELNDDIAKFPATAWTKLYRADFINKNGIKFQEIKIGQDQLFFFHSMIKARRLAVLHENLYNYRKNRAGSAMTVSKKKDFSPLYVFYGIENLLKDENLINEYKNILINRYFTKALTRLAKFEPLRKREYFDGCQKLHSHIKQNYPDGWWVYVSLKKYDSLPVLRLKILFASIIYLMSKCGQILRVSFSTLCSPLNHRSC